MPLPALASLAVMATACMPAVQSETETEAKPRSAEFYEFANMRPSNIIPKSSPAAYERAFERFCLNGGTSSAAVAASLRKSDYVAVPGPASNGQRAFVVDDTRPLVVISDDARFCAVVAQSRTGQTARIERFLAKRFAGATKIAQRPAGYELLLETQGDVIALKRLTSGVTGSRVLLAIERQGADASLPRPAQTRADS